MSQNSAWENDCDFTQDNERVNLCEDSDAENVKFKVINHIPLKYRTKKVWYIAFSALIATVLIIIITIISTKNTVLASNKNSNGKLYSIVNKTKVVRHDHETDRQILQYEISTFSTLLSYEIGENVNRFWVENLTDISSIVAEMNNNRTVLLQEKRFKPNALAFDHVSGNLYATDDNAGLLITMNAHSGYFLIILADMIRPRDIVLDSNEGLLFVLQHEHSILRANTYGSDPTEIVSKNGTRALSIDPSKKRLYWINDFLSVESSDYSGENRSVIFTSTTKIATLTISDSNLFWIERNEKENTIILFTCELATDGNCEKRAVGNVDIVDHTTSIRSYISVNKSTTNPCEPDNGGCEQLCLLSGRNTISCACRMGWNLNADNRTCEEVRDFVLYTYGDVVRTCSLDGSRELFWPTPYSVDKLTVKTYIDFEYDLKNDYFYFTDDHHIHRMKLKSHSDQETILSVNSSDMIIEDIAYDWFTGNMYYGQRHVNATLEHSLMMFNTRLGESYRKRLKTFNRDYKVRSYALAIHPATGYLFVVVTRELDDDINVYRIKVDGTDFSRDYHFYAGGVRDHRFFTIDYSANRIYEMIETGRKLWIAYSDIVFRGIRFPDGHPDFAGAKTIAVHEQWLYLSNFSSIFRFDKETGRGEFQIGPRVNDPTKEIVGVRVISEKVQSTGSDNPCAKNNGGCEQFCFAESKAICDCKDGQKVNDSGRCK